MPGGAIDAIAAGALNGVSRIFALHCDPARGRQGGGDSGGLRRPPIRWNHAASPVAHLAAHLTGDLVYALGTLITGVPGVLSRRVDPRDSTVMVWGAVNAGVAANAIPQSGTVAGTIRTASREAWVAMETLVREIVSALVATLNLEYSVQYRRGVPPVVNEAISTRILTHAIEGVGQDVLTDTRQSGGGEDFSWYLEEVPGAMARLGVWSGHGPQLDLHQPTFDLDERALAVGVRVMTNIVEQSALL
jgi:amidohydrolase